MDELEKLKRDATENLEYILRQLEYDREFYEPDIEYEYTPFEENVKSFCDNYIDRYIEYERYEDAFNILAGLVEGIVEYDLDEDDIFRPVELITYYFAKIITYSPSALRNRIYNWMYKFVEEYEGYSSIADNYFRVFLEGRMIYHADEYYTGYDDYERVLSYYKD